MKTPPNIKELCLGLRIPGPCFPLTCADSDYDLLCIFCVTVLGTDRITTGAQEKGPPAASGPQPALPIHPLLEAQEQFSVSHPLRKIILLFPILACLCCLWNLPSRDPGPSE